MAAALGGARAVGAPRGSRRGSAPGTGVTGRAGRGAPPPRGRAGQRPPERKAARLAGSGRRRPERRCPRLGSPAARQPADPARAYLPRRRSRKSGAAAHTCKSRPGGGGNHTRPPPGPRARPRHPRARPASLACAPRASGLGLRDAERGACPAALRGLLGSRGVPGAGFQLQKVPKQTLGSATPEAQPLWGPPALWVPWAVCLSVLRWPSADASAARGARGGPCAPARPRPPRRLRPAGRRLAPRGALVPSRRQSGLIFLNVQSLFIAQ